MYLYIRGLVGTMKYEFEDVDKYRCHLCGKLKTEKEMMIRCRACGYGVCNECTKGKW